MAAAQLGEGLGRDAMVSSALASRVKRAGGDAAILMGADRSMSGMAPVGTMLVALDQRTGRFRVVRHLD